MSTKEFRGDPRYKVIQSDVRHECHVPMWHCSSCQEDYCGEQPKYCPNCGVLFDKVVLKEE